jgi:hypothetical protein
MKLVSMKVSAADQRKRETVMSKPSENEYPYGLQLHLDTETLDKLGADLPEVETEVVIMAKAKVTSVSSSEGAHGASRSMTIQITQLGLAPAGDDDKDHSSKLYKD